MARLNPFAGLEKPREVWAWGMYDLANQSFTLLINTLLFAIYFKEVVVGDPARGDLLWGMTYAGSMLLVVVASPFMGTLADCRGWRKSMLIGTGIACSGLTAALGLAGVGDVWLAIAIYIPANLLYQLGENFLASFLPSVSTGRTIGRVSATGWAMGYAGALILLICVSAAALWMGMKASSDWPPLFVFAGLWFLLNMIPAALLLQEPKTVRLERGQTIAGEVIARMVGTIRSAGRYRQFGRFLIAFFVFGMGVQVIIAFASIIATDFGFGTIKLFAFIAQLTITAGIAAIGTAVYQDRLGAKRTVILFLIVWLASTAGLFGMSLMNNPSEWMFWLIGNGIGFGIGGIGTSARSLVGRFTPGHKTAEFFGLWGMTYKLAGVVGVASFAQIKAGIGMSESLALLSGFFIAGLALLLVVDERSGYRAARRSERDANGSKRAILGDPSVTPPA